MLQLFAKRRKPPTALAKIDYEEEEGDRPPVKYVAPPPAYSPSLVYVGTMDNGVDSLRQFSLLICNVLAIAAPIMMYRQTLDLTTSKGMTLSVLYISTAWVPYFLNKSYVAEMTFDQENKIFVAATKNLWMRKKMVEFTPSDVTLPKLPLPFTLVYAKRTPLFFAAEGWKHLGAKDQLLLCGKQE